MRRRIIPEGVESVDARLLKPHAVVLPVDAIPLMRTPEDARDGHDGAVLVGTVTEVRREEDGWITGVTSVELEDGEALEADCGVMIAAQECTEDLMVIASTNLVGVTIGRRPCWPECGEVVA